MAEHLAEGAVLDGRIRLERRLGSGGFSSVWRATELTTDAAVAVKILHAGHEATVGAVERFRQEAELLSSLEHQSIARAYLDRTTSAPRFFTLEYVEGETLQARMQRRSAKRHAIPLIGIAWLCDRICDALACAHEHAVVHRDLKPANIMVNAPRKPPFVKVLDFGAAKSLDNERFDPTTIGRVIGSIAYMTPEQMRQRPVDGRTDQFALAVILYELITLRRAWATDVYGEPLVAHASIGDANSQLDIMKRILRGERPRASAVRDDVPASVDEVLVRGMSTSPEERFEDITTFRGAFRAAMLDAPELMPAWNPSDEMETGPFDDAGPTASVSGPVETVVQGMNTPDAEVPSTTELPQLLDDGSIAATDRGPAIPAGIAAADTVVGDFEETADELDDISLTATLEAPPSTGGAQRGK
ncbi:MAG: serine/threonine-protein kinase [Deltaproteobacteria bacterium]|jgi:serine/threonine protein kinase